MNDAISALIITPVWGSFMSQVAKDFPPENFKAPLPASSDLKPVMRGIWQGGVSYWIDSISGKVATPYTPQETRKEIVFDSVHSILQWVDKGDPLGPVPTNPSEDPQYSNWEYGVRGWFYTWKKSNLDFKETTDFTVPTATDDIHTPENTPKISIASPAENASVDANKLLTVNLQETGKYPAQKSELYLNGKYVLTNTTNPLSISFVPADIGGLGAMNTISVVLYDTAYDQATSSVDFSIL
jgi:hypothetical protein